jgi:hypothetical protein
VNMLPSIWPGVVKSYDAQKRICRVEIPGITDGSSELPEAEIMQSLGDKSEHTEIRILVGDRVWLNFAGGDPRFPVITGFRAKETGNSTEWRRWHHANFEFTADGMLRINATNIEINGITTINGVTTVNGQTTVNGATAINSTLDVSGMSTLAGGARVTGEMKNNGTDVGSGHRHPGVQTGGGTTGTPT